MGLPVRDEDELRMDAQDMMEEIERARFLVEDLESENGLCIHGVSKYRMCSQCLRIWEKNELMSA